MNWSTPAPEPVGLYARVLPEHVWPHTLLNSAMAFCWAVEPSAVTEFLPAQSAAALWLPAGLAAPLLLAVPEVVSPAHAGGVRAGSCVGGPALPVGGATVLARLLSFPGPTFGVRLWNTLPSNSPW